MHNKPYAIRVLLESAQQQFDGKRITKTHLERLKNWQPNAERVSEIPLKPARVILQDYTGVPLLADLAALRDCAAEAGFDPAKIEPRIPVDFVIDHSLQTNRTNVPGAAELNAKLEFERNRERFEFIKWGGQAFQKMRVFPPGSGIVHQLNLEYIAKGVVRDGDLLMVDTVIGTDSHTSMVNGMGIVGWGVGGIEAEAAMLGQPIYCQVPDVIGVKLIGKPKAGVSTTDIVLNITEVLRSANVIGKIVEYSGDGARALSVPDRCTIANMAPDYGATMGLFHVDQNTLDYYEQTGRSAEQIQDIENFYRAKGWFDLDSSAIEYTDVITVDLSLVEPCIAGPKHPSQKVLLGDVKECLSSSHGLTGGSRKINKRLDPAVKPRDDDAGGLGNGDILLAAITSCTNTANPNLMVAAGLLAQKAVSKGLRVNPKVKCSLTPGSLAVTAYLEKLDLQTALDALGFYHSGYGCAACAGNSGDLDPELEKQVVENDITACSVLSGNRNFEARIHPKLKANFLMSPALVVAYAIAGNIQVDLTTEALGHDQNGHPVYLKDIWPSATEISDALGVAQDAALYREVYAKQLGQASELWESIPVKGGLQFDWDPNSTYVRRPPFVGFAAMGFSKSTTNCEV